MEIGINKNTSTHFIPIVILVAGISLFAYATSFISINLSNSNPINRIFFTADFKLAANNNGSYSIVLNHPDRPLNQSNYLLLGQNTALQTSLLR